MKKTPYNNEIYNCFPMLDRKSYSALCLRKTEMVMRGRVEAAFASRLVFITLTYDSVHLPDTYKKVKDIQLFHQRKTRKKVTFLSDCPSYIYDVEKKKRVRNPDYKEYKWIEKDSRPLNLKGNIYRHKEIFDQQDFKNAKHKFSLTNPRFKDYGLLVPLHLSDFLECLRNDMRLKFNDVNLRLRFIANGEYGEHTHRPHYHLLIFDHYPSYDYDLFMRTYWNYGRILQCQYVNPTESISIKKMTAYIVGHTVKHDSGNVYQSELSPAFRLMSTFDGGIGKDLLDTNKVNSLPVSNGVSNDFDDNYVFVRSLSFSLSTWDKKSSVKYVVRDDKGNLLPFEFPRYFKDKILDYKSLDKRSYYESMCRSIQNVVKSFCQFYGLYGDFDMLDLYLNIGLCKDVSTLLTFFMISNRKKLSNFLLGSQNFTYFADRFLQSLRASDSVARATFKKRYSNRKQDKKYLDYLSKSGFENLD